MKKNVKKPVTMFLNPCFSHCGTCFVGLSLQYVLNWCAFLKSSMEKVLSSDFKCDAFWTFSIC